ncbi:MAG: sixA [Gammaproteobacteria bacterium]|jgi:phosphohistidine phosphatase|nr:sixA [Gammaproteobacteria bacterium]
MRQIMARNILLYIPLFIFIRAEYVAKKITRDFSMKLYLVRHGEAGTHNTDAQRPLTNTGTAQVERLAEHFVQIAAKPLHIYHSGLLRAQQTAEIIAHKLDVEDIHKIAHLHSGDLVFPIRDKIDGWREDTVLVGHMPYMGVLLDNLMDKEMLISFGTATGVCLQRQVEDWAIEWVFHGANKVV